MFDSSSVMQNPSFVMLNVSEASLSQRSFAVAQDDMGGTLFLLVFDRTDK